MPPHPVQLSEALKQPSLGPTQYRLNPAYKDRPRSDPRAVVEFYLSRSGRWEWVYPGPRGEHLR